MEADEVVQLNPDESPIENLEAEERQVVENIEGGIIVSDV